MKVNWNVICSLDNMNDLAVCIWSKIGQSSVTFWNIMLKMWVYLFFWIELYLSEVLLVICQWMLGQTEQIEEGDYNQMTSFHIYLDIMCLKLLCFWDTEIMNFFSFSYLESGFLLFSKNALIFTITKIFMFLLIYFQDWGLLSDAGSLETAPVDIW